MKRKILSIAFLLAVALPLTSGLTGCAVLSCDNYMTYDDVLDSWVGGELSAYEQRTDNRAYKTMERPQNRIEYAFNTPYQNYDGTIEACRTFLEVDRSSGKIESWSHEGSCYMHGYCND